MIDLVAGLVGVLIAVGVLVVLKIRADRHDAVRKWIGDAERLGLAHRFSPLADVGSEAAGEREGRAVIVRGARDVDDAPETRVLVGFARAVPLGMELTSPPAQPLYAVYREQKKLPSAAGWAYRAVETKAAKALVKAIDEALQGARQQADGVRVHDGGVALWRWGEATRSELSELLAARGAARPRDRARVRRPRGGAAGGAGELAPISRRGTGWRSIPRRA